MRILILENSELHKMITTCICVERLYITQLSNSSNWVILQCVAVYSYEGSGKT